MSNASESPGATSWDVLSSEVEDTRTRVGVQVEFVSDALAQQQHSVLRPFINRGITSRDDYRTLAVIRRFGERGASITETAEILGVSPGTISNRVERLRKEGHLMRIPNERDRRSHRVSFTPQGAELVAQMNEAMINVHKSFLEALDETQCEQLSELLEICME
ncbi:MAG: MarR family transcriptional regulator [Acidimicrobiaceae bacterium]|nr:MarR family transcriptional regulator [Acidimicrobiaceae bacterium]